MNDLSYEQFFDDGGFTDPLSASGTPPPPPGSQDANPLAPLGALFPPTSAPTPPPTPAQALRARFQDPTADPTASSRVNTAFSPQGDIDKQLASSEDAAVYQTSPVTPPATPLGQQPGPQSTPTGSAPPMPGPGQAITPPATPLGAPAPQGPATATNGPAGATPVSAPQGPGGPPSSGEAIDAASRDPAPPFTAANPRTMAQLSSVLETGRPDGIGNISPDTHNSKSYGMWGMNSYTGSAEAFVQQYGRSLGLTARPGTPEFDAQWRASAQRNPQGMYNAQMDYYQRNILPMAETGMRAYGISPQIANDPRVQAYMADRYVQMGTVGQHAALTAARAARSPEEFIGRMSAVDKQNIGNNFRSYLSENPQNMRGLVNRVDRRQQMALNGGQFSADNTQLTSGADTPVGGNPTNARTGVRDSTPVRAPQNGYGAQSSAGPTPVSMPEGEQPEPGAGPGIGAMGRGVGNAISTGARGLGDMIQNIGAGFGGPNMQMEALRYQLMRSAVQGGHMAGMDSQGISDHIRGMGKAAAPPDPEEQGPGEGAPTGAAVPGAGTPGAAGPSGAGVSQPRAESLAQTKGFNGPGAVNAYMRDIENRQQTLQAQAGTFGMAGLNRPDIAQQQQILMNEQQTLRNAVMEDAAARTNPVPVVGPGGETRYGQPGQTAAGQAPARSPIMGVQPGQEQTQPGRARDTGNQPAWMNADPGPATRLGTVARLPPEVAPGREALRNRDNAIGEARATNQQAAERLEDLKKILPEIKTGRFADARMQVGQIADELGIPVPKKLDAAGYQEFIKDAAGNVLSSVKSANEGTGTKMLVSEIENAKKYSPSTGLTPEANAHLINQSLGILDWQNKYLHDFHTWYNRNPSAYTTGDFDDKWHSDPNNSLHNVFTKSREADQIVPAASRTIGQIYNTPRGPYRWTGTGWTQGQ